MLTLLVRAHVVFFATEQTWRQKANDRRPPPWILIFYGKRVDQEPRWMQRTTYDPPKSSKLRLPECGKRVWSNRQPPRTQWTKVTKKEWPIEFAMSPEMMNGGGKYGFRGKHNKKLSRLIPVRTYPECNQVVIWRHFSR